jgi:hypothetical protein
MSAKWKNNLILWSKVDFVIKDEIIFSIKDCTLPEAIEAGKEFKPIDNFSIKIQCYY